GGQRLHIPPLAFGVDRVEGERRLARPADAGDDHQLADGQRDVDILEVVRACAAYNEIGGPIAGGLHSQVSWRMFKQRSYRRDGAEATSVWLRGSVGRDLGEKRVQLIRFVSGQPGEQLTLGGAL